MISDLQNMHCRYPALAIMLLCMLALAGCARFSGQSKTKYVTVAANDRHDTPTAKRKHRKALVYLEAGEGGHKLAKAEDLLNQALVADVTYGPAHNSLGMVYYLQNKLYLAAWEYEYAVKLMPGMTQPLNNLGLVYERVGKYEDAISYYSMALGHEPNNPQVLGNLVRTRMIAGDKSKDLKDMVSELALTHPQPSWQRWARDQVELVKFETEDKGLRNLLLDPNKTPDSLPTPISEPDILPGDSIDLQFPESIAPGQG